MTGVVVVTGAQVKAAQMLVERDRALGREPDPATLKIAEARQEASPSKTPGDPSISAPVTGSFWEALDQTEQEALRAVASWRTFAAGERLMGQGEPADQVIVIFGGRTKISVHKDSKESVLAIRGLGQLVGERAAFESGIRSATVTALEVVWAMVVRSEDFATFIAAHPRVVSILYDQLYSRLTEGPTESGVAAAEPAISFPQRRLRVLNGENCTVVLSSVVGFGARIPGDRLLIREALRAMMAAALQGVPDIRTVDQGDGFLTVLPPNVSTAEIMSRLFKELPAAIERHNKSQHDSARIQLRLAINVGPVFGDIEEFSGEVILVTSRLLEAPYFEEATAENAILTVVISPFVFETVIRPGPDLNEVASYRQVPVEVRGSSTIAWMKMLPRDPIIGNTAASI